MATPSIASLRITTGGAHQQPAGCGEEEGLELVLAREVAGPAALRAVTLLDKVFVEMGEESDDLSR